MLLRFALCGKTSPAEAFGLPTDDQWTALYRLAARQGVLALAWDGLSGLHRAEIPVADRMPPRPLRLQWAMNVERIERRYRRQQAAALKLGGLLAEEGIRATVFKGLSLSLLYPVPEHRECGDVDLYPLDADFRQVDRLAEADGARIAHVSPKHSEFAYAGAEFENHRHFTTEYLSSENRRINRELIASLAATEPLFGCEALRRPGYAFDELFVMRHAAGHFAREGIALRHVADWMLLLRAHDYRPDFDRLHRYGLDRFAAVLHRIGCECMGFDPPEAICSPDEGLCRRVLGDLLAHGTDDGKKLRGLRLVGHKIRRFTSRRWTYPLAGESYAAALLRSVYVHLAHPEFLFGVRRK